MLPWVDRLFGTWHLPRGEWPAAYGVEEPLPAGLVGQLLHPFRRRRGVASGGSILPPANEGRTN